MKPLFHCLLVLVYCSLTATSGFAASKCIHSPSEKIVSDYIDDLEKNKNQLFYSHYEYFNKALSEKITTVLIIEIGKTKGIMIERDACTITNVAYISYSGEYNSLVVDETHGGAATYEEKGKLLDKLSESSFKLIEPKQLRIILKIKGI